MHFMSLFDQHICKDLFSKSHVHTFMRISFFITNFKLKEYAFIKYQDNILIHTI